MKKKLMLAIGAGFGLYLSSGFSAEYLEINGKISKLEYTQTGAQNIPYFKRRYGDKKTIETILEKIDSCRSEIIIDGKRIFGINESNSWIKLKGISLENSQIWYYIEGENFKGIGLKFKYTNNENNSYGLLLDVTEEKKHQIKKISGPGLGDVLDTMGFIKSNSKIKRFMKKHLRKGVIVYNFIDPRNSKETTLALPTLKYKIPPEFKIAYENQVKLAKKEIKSKNYQCEKESNLKSLFF